MNDDLLDIPDFLRVENRKPPPEGFVLRKPRRTSKRRRQSFQLPKVMTADAWALLRAIEYDKRQRKIERLKKLHAQHSNRT